MLAPLNNISRHNFWFYNVLLKVEIKMNMINKCSHCFFMLTNGTMVSVTKVSLRQVVTRRPSLKRLSGIQVQLLSLCMGIHKILQNCSLSLRLNFIFETTNEIGQQLCHKCCFFCSNSIIKSVFFRLDQPVRMRSPDRVSQSADCFYSNRDF